MFIACFAGALMVHLTERWSKLEITCRKYPTRVFLGIMAVQVVGLLLFTSGFLLSRVQLGKFSSDNGAVGESGLGADVAVDRTAPAFKKAMFLMIDALRLDFVCAQPYSMPSPLGSHVESMQGLRAVVSLLVRTCRAKST